MLFPVQPSDRSGPPAAAGAASEIPNPVSRPQATAAPKVRAIETEVNGRLGLMLLSGRHGMADSLSMLTDALGRILNLARRDGETSLLYALRLAEAIEGLPPRERQEADRLLNLIVAGIRLRLVAEALSDPGGPEAARVIAWLELARNRDRDASQSVISRYSEHGPAAGRQAAQAQMASPLDPIAAAAPAETGEPVPAAGLDMTGQAGAGLDEGTSIPMPRAPEGAKPGLPTRSAEMMAKAPTEPDNRPVGDHRAAATPRQTEEGTRMIDPVARSAAPATLSDRQRMFAAHADARSLQEILRQAFDGEDGARTATGRSPAGQALIERATARPLPPTEAGPGHPDALRQEQAAADARSTVQEPAMADRRNPLPDRAPTTAMTLKGWQEVEDLLSLSIDLPQSVDGSADGSDSLYGPRMPLPTTETEAAEAKGRALPMPSRSSQATSPANAPVFAGPEDTAEAGSAAALLRNLDERAAQPSPMATVAGSFAPREAIPFAYVGLSPAQDESQETTQARRHRSEDDEDSPRGDASRKDHRDRPSDEEPCGEADGADSTTAAELVEPGEPVDGAWDFYQRMAAGLI